MKIHETVPPQAARLLRRVCKRILDEPRQFLMDSYFTEDMPFKVPNCGTAACIAGWVATLTLNTNPENASVIVYDPHYRAKQILGLSELQAGSLFYEDKWPDQFHEAWNRTRETHAVRRAHIAVKRIEHFIQTGE